MFRNISSTLFTLSCVFAVGMHQRHKSVIKKSDVTELRHAERDMQNGMLEAKLLSLGIMGNLSKIQ